MVCLSNNFFRFFVIIGALATSEQIECLTLILKTLSCKKVILSILLRSIIIGSFAGLVAISLGL